MKKLKSLLDSIIFLLHLQTKELALENTEEIEIPKKNGRLKADVYFPFKKKYKGTIISINGLAPKGNRDPRIIKVNQSLQKAGYVVVCPFFEEICNYKISLNNIQDIKDSITYIAQQSNLAPTNRVSILSPSFSGALSLIAASDQEISKYISTICTIGAYGNVETILENLFSIQEMDEYGRMILLYNFLPLSIGNKPNIIKAFYYSALDNYYKYFDPRLDNHLAKMTQKDREFFFQIKNDSDFRMKHWNNILIKGGESRILLTELSVLTHISKINLPILLVHGKEDDVVPSAESILVYDLLQKLKVKSKLCVTNLISHGDTGMDAKSLKQIPKVVNSFAFFFEHINT
jgi:pimeloyl-ACP methyl ester carboxylesterase